MFRIDYSGPEVEGKLIRMVGLSIVVGRHSGVVRFWIYFESRIIRTC